MVIQSLTGAKATPQPTTSSSVSSGVIQPLTKATQSAKTVSTQSSSVIQPLGSRSTGNPGYVAPKPQPVKQSPTLVQSAENAVGGIINDIKGIFTPNGGKPQPIKTPPTQTATQSAPLKVTTPPKVGEKLPGYTPPANPKDNNLIDLLFSNPSQFLPQTGKAIETTFPQATKQLQQLLRDPLNEKADPKKVLTDYVSGIKTSIEAAGDDWRQVFTNGTVNPPSTSQRVGSGLKATAETVGALTSPITSLFSAAQDIPGTKGQAFNVGTIAKVINLAFTAVGEGATDVSNSLVDALPIDANIKSDVKPGVAAIISLAAQLALGKAGEVSKVKPTLVDRFGETDANTIITQAKTLAQNENKSLVQRVTSGVATPAEIQKYQTLSTAGKLREFTESGHAGYLPEKAGGTLRVTPEQAQSIVVGSNIENTAIGKEILKTSLRAAKTGNSLELDLANGVKSNFHTPGGVGIAEIREVPSTPSTTPLPYSKTAENALVEAKNKIGGVEQQSRGVDQNVTKLQKFFEKSDNPIQKENEKYLTNNLEKATDDYTKKVTETYGMPNVISADDAKYILPGFESKHSNNYHSAASSFSKYLYEEKLQTQKGKGNNTVMFLSGGTGAGKTTALKTANPELQNYSLIYDTNLVGKSALAKIDKALKSGYKVEVDYVNRNPVTAFTKGVIPRIKEEGRLISIEDHIQKHEGSLETVKAIATKYGDNVQIRYIDNNGEKGTAKEIPVENIPENTYTKDELRKVLHEETNKAVKENSITPEEANVIRESASEQGSVSAGTKPQQESPEEIGKPENEINPQSGSVQLNAGIDPGLKQFFEQEIQPAFHAASDIKNEWSNVINPPKASEKAAKAANAIRNAEAHISNYRNILDSKLNNWEKFYDRYSDKQLIKVLSNFEKTGEWKVTPKPLKDTVDFPIFYKKASDEAYQVLLAAYGKDPETYIENYVRHAYVFGTKVDEAKGTSFLTNYMRSLSANKSPLKGRVLKDMSIEEGLLNMKKRGIKVKMADTNPVKLLKWSMVNAQQALAYRKAWNEAKTSKLITFVRNGQALPEGVVRLNDQAAEIFAPAEVRIGDGKTPHDQALSVGRYYADPSVARVFNNAISSGLEGSPTYKGIRAITNTMSQFQLGFSAFHFGAVGIDAGVTDLSIGMRYLLLGKPVKAVSHLATGTVPFASFFKDMYHGKRLIDDLKNNSPEAYAFLEKKLNPAGGRLGQDEFYRNETWKSIQHALLNNNPIGATLRTAFHLPSAIIQTLSHPLLGYAVPRVKLGAFMDLAEAKLATLPPDASDFARKQALVSAWTSVDNRMGQLAYKNLFWNKVGKDIAMMSVRSVGWDLGTIRELGGAVTDVPKILRGKGISDRVLWGASLVAYVGLLGAIYQVLHTGQWPQDLKDYFHPRNGLTDKNGNPDRIALPSYLKDVYAYSHDPIQTTLNKSSPLLSSIADLIQNKDYYGNLIRNPNDPIGTQLAQLGQYALNSLIPFSISTALNKSQEGSNLEQQAESFFGIIKAPQAVIQSDAQKAAIKAYENQVGAPGAKTPEQVAIAKLKTKAYDEIKAHGAAGSPSYQQLVKNGTLNTQRKRLLFLKNAKLTGMQRLVSHLPKAVRKNLKK